MNFYYIYKSLDYSIRVRSNDWVPIPISITSSCSSCPVAIIPKGVISLSISSSVFSFVFSLYFLNIFCISSISFCSFSDTSLQAAASINTAYGMTFNTTDSSNGVSIGSPTSRLVVDYQGVYNVQFSAQLDKTSGGAGNVYIWLRKNGTNVPNTASTVAIQGTAARTVAAWNFIIQLEPTNYVELMWAVDDTSVRILAASATSVWPAIPSVICTVITKTNLSATAVIAAHSLTNKCWLEIMKMARFIN